MLRRLWYPLVVVALLGQMAFAMVTTAMQQSPTIDEPVYVATAEVYTQQHSLRFNPEHPPLGKLILAAGLAFTDVRLDTGVLTNQTRLARHVLYESGNNPYRVMLLARLPVILLTLLFGLVVLAFARDLAGPAAGLIALALYAFSPDVIAHGSLATLDVPAVGMMLTALWFLWRARNRPGLYLPLTAVMVGAALATRMSALPAVPVMVLLAALSTWHAQRARPAEPAPGPVAEAPAEAEADAEAETKGETEAAPEAEPEAETEKEQPEKAAPQRDWPHRLLISFGAAAGVGLMSIAVVWIVYLAVDPHLRWTTPANLPHPDGLRGHLVDLLPFPQAYRDGMLIQFKIENQVHNGFLLGQAYKGTLWYYLPVATLIKTPLGMLALWLAGAITMLVVRRLRTAAIYLLPVTAVLMAVAMTGTRDYGSRYVLFLPVFLAVAAGSVALIRFRWAHAVTAALVLFVGVSSLRTFPYYLPYSNEAFGGTANTHENLHDSNVDWGQDLARLAQRLRTAYPGEKIWLVYKGSGSPSYYGITASDPYSTPEQNVRGLLVISDSRVALASKRLQYLIDTSTPIDQVGYSITIYRR
ncbi:glycosyltransferase family 39 protein [Actinoplanes sp. NPDC051851]|uniref:ArnT family glycosyltransferase n=1 Tax=Actinoplanes sp. NPDC051851 TaxID=3154753 RepID=UPI0034262B5F